MTKAPVLLLVVAIAIAYWNPSVRKTAVVQTFILLNKGLTYLANADPTTNWALMGNYGPVSGEVAYEHLPVTVGKLPSDLDGLFSRVGSNPLQPETGHYHWFDGHGMIHTVSIKDGKLNYTATFVQTNKFKEETEAGTPFFGRLGALRGITGLIRLLLFRTLVQPVLGYESVRLGPANTALMFHHGVLLAMDEVSAPFEMDVYNDGKLTSRGYTDFNGQWKYPFSAHSKVDPSTGHLIFFAYRFSSAPYCIHGISDKFGNVRQTVTVEIPEPVMMHDFAITEHYSIIMDLPFVFKQNEIINDKIPFIFNSSRPSRFGILHRSARNSNDVRWFEAAPCFIYHTMNAWEDGDDVVLVASRFKEMTLNYQNGFPNQSVWEYRFSLKTGKTQEREISNLALEFPVINPKFLGKFTNFGYFASVVHEGISKLNGITKLDVQNSRVLSQYKYGPGIYGGEAVFVPKKNSAKQDDGYLLTYVFNEHTEKSSFVVLDASEMVLVASVEIPRRIPYGFHGLFIAREELNNI